jgi:hypothetical protein
MCLCFIYVFYLDRFDVDAIDMLAHPQLVSAQVNVSNFEHFNKLYAGFERLWHLKPQLHKLVLANNQSQADCMIVPGMRVMEWANISSLTLVQPAGHTQHRYHQMFYTNLAIALTFNKTLREFSIIGRLCDLPACLTERANFLQAITNHSRLESLVSFFAISLFSSFSFLILFSPLSFLFSKKKQSNCQKLLYRLWSC